MWGSRYRGRSTKAHEQPEPSQTRCGFDRALQEAYRRVRSDAPADARDAGSGGQGDGDEGGVYRQNNGLSIGLAQLCGWLAWTTRS